MRAPCSVSLVQLIVATIPGLLAPPRGRCCAVLPPKSNFSSNVLVSDSESTVFILEPYALLEKVVRSAGDAGKANRASEANLACRHGRAHFRSPRWSLRERQDHRREALGTRSRVSLFRYRGDVPNRRALGATQRRRTR